MRGDRQDGFDAGEQHEGSVEALGVELREARAHEPRVAAVPELRRGDEAQDADAVVVVAPPGVERGEHDAGALGALGIGEAQFEPKL